MALKVRSAGTVTATLSYGRVLGKATKVVKRAGKVSLTVRLTPAAKRGWPGLKGKRVSLRLDVQAPRGAAIVTTRALRVG